MPSIRKVKKTKEFEAAKKLALTLKTGFEGCDYIMKRATVDGVRVNYLSANIKGRRYVIADEKDGILDPDVLIDGYPAREVFLKKIRITVTL